MKKSIVPSYANETATWTSTTTGKNNNFTPTHLNTMELQPLTLERLNLTSMKIEKRNVDDLLPEKEFTDVCPTSLRASFSYSRYNWNIERRQKWLFLFADILLVLFFTPRDYVLFGNMVVMLLLPFLLISVQVIIIIRQTSFSSTYYPRESVVLHISTISCILRAFSDKRADTI